MTSKKFIKKQYASTIRRLISSRSNINCNSNRLEVETNNKIHNVHHRPESLFSLYADPATQKINMGHFLSALEKTGLRRTDPRFKCLMKTLDELHEEIGEEGKTSENIDLSFDSFQKLTEKNIVLLSQAFSQRLIVPDFTDFCAHLREIYRRCRDNNKVILRCNIVSNIILLINNTNFWP